MVNKKHFHRICTRTISAGAASIVTPATRARLVTALTPSNVCVSASHLMPESGSAVRSLCQVSLKLGSGECQTSTVVLFACPAIPGPASLKHPRPGAGHCSAQAGYCRLRLRACGHTGTERVQRRTRARVDILTVQPYLAVRCVQTFSNVKAISLRRIYKTTYDFSLIWRKCIYCSRKNICLWALERREICLGLGFADPPISYLTNKETRGMLDDEISKIGQGRADH